MSLSTAEVRDGFKHKLSDWEVTLQQSTIAQQNITDMHVSITSLLNDLQERSTLLQEDFCQRHLDAENRQSIDNSFVHLEGMAAKAKKDLIDISHQPLEKQLGLVKSLYVKYLIPAFNLLLNLENEFVSATTHDILEKGKKLAIFEEELQLLKQEKETIRKKIFDLNRKEKYKAVIKKIKKVELQRKMTKLTLHHDKLNLYFFTHHRPPELKEIKEKTDKMRQELKEIEEVK